MPETWATSFRNTAGVDLHLDLAGRHLRASLEGALRDAVRSGRLGPGTRLPSSRALAGDLGVARNTVADAYAQLLAEGWLTARQGSSTRVADRVATAPAPDGPGEPGAAAGPGTGPGPDRDRDRKSRYDLQPGSPDLAAFPRTAWLAASRRALDAAPAAAFGYSDPRGRPELRRALAGYLARARGVRASPDSVVVCAGFAQGLALLSRVLAARGGATLAVEAYGLPAHRDTVAAAGLAVVPVPVDARGAATAGLGTAAGALLTPAHQFPLGMVLHPQRRAQAVAWARDTGGLLIEDDYDGEFRYDRQPVGAMQALAPEHVVYAGSASKSLAPGLRLGWLVLPRGLIDEVVAARLLADRQSGAFDQLTLAELITGGGYDRHVRRARLAYRRRRDRLAQALAAAAPQVRVTGIAAGLHALAELPAGQDEDEVVARAGARGLHLQGLRPYSAAGAADRPALVVGYATPPQHAFTGALARLTAVLAAR
jgi:GntR family transcriptional regulator / MocR family aminotransferase